MNKHSWVYKPRLLSHKSSGKCPICGEGILDPAHWDIIDGTKQLIVDDAEYLIVDRKPKRKPMTFRLGDLIVTNVVSGMVSAWVIYNLM